MSIVSRVAFAVCFLLVAAATGWAQDGVITGRVTDPSGGALPGVDVALTSPALLGGRSAVSDEQGTYRFAAAPARGLQCPVPASGLRHGRSGRHHAHAGLHLQPQHRDGRRLPGGNRDRDRGITDRRCHERRCRHQLLEGVDGGTADRSRRVLDARDHTRRPGNGARRRRQPRRAARTVPRVRQHLAVECHRGRHHGVTAVPRIRTSTKRSRWRAQARAPTRPSEARSTTSS